MDVNLNFASFEEYSQKVTEAEATIGQRVGKGIPSDKNAFTRVEYQQMLRTAGAIASFALAIIFFVAAAQTSAVFIIPLLPTIVCAVGLAVWTISEEQYLDLELRSDRTFLTNRISRLSFTYMHKVLDEEEVKARDVTKYKLLGMKATHRQYAAFEEMSKLHREVTLLATRIIDDHKRAEFRKTSFKQIDELYKKLCGETPIVVEESASGQSKTEREVESSAHLINLLSDQPKPTGVPMQAPGVDLLGDFVFVNGKAVAGKPDVATFDGQSIRDFETTEEFGQWLKEQT